MGLQDHGSLLFLHFSLPEQAALKCYVLNPPAKEYQNCGERETQCNCTAYRQAVGRLVDSFQGTQCLLLCETTVVCEFRVVLCRARSCTQWSVWVSSNLGYSMITFWSALKRSRPLSPVALTRRLNILIMNLNLFLVALGRMLHLAQYWVIANWDEWSFSASLWK